MNNKYIKCFSKEKADELKNVGFKELYFQNGVFYFSNDEKISLKFSKTNILKDVKFTATLNF